MPEVAKFLFTSLKTRHFVNLLPLSSSNSPAISAIRVSWRGGSVASARLSKFQSTWLAPLLVLRHHQKGLAPQKLGSHNASNERDQIFPTPLRVWFSEILWISGVALVDSHWENTGLRANSRAPICVSGDIFHYAAQISSFYRPLRIVCVNVIIGCSRPKHKLFLHNTYNHVQS